MSQKTLPKTDEERVNVSNEIAIRAPQTIICPNKNCNSLVGKLLVDLRQSDKFKSSMFQGPMIRPSGLCKCHNCGCPWVLPNPGIIHTKNGWLPAIK